MPTQADFAWAQSLLEPFFNKLSHLKDKHGRRLFQEMPRLDIEDPVLVHGKPLWWWLTYNPLTLAMILDGASPASARDEDGNL